MRSDRKKKTENRNNKIMNSFKKKNEKNIIEEPRISQREKKKNDQLT